MVGVMAVLGNLLQKDLCQHIQDCWSQLLGESVPLTLRQATVTHVSARDSWTLMGKYA